MGDTFVNEDLNGECFIAGSEGEQERDRIEARVVKLAGDVFDPAHIMGSADINQFFYDQVNHLITHVSPTDTAINVELACKIAYLRCLALKTGLYDTTHDAAYYNCTHTDFVTIAGHHNPTNVTKNTYNAHLTEAVKKTLRMKFTNMVCAVAYIFRVRGHHYMEGFEAKYAQIWRRSLYEEDHPGVPWKYIAIHVCHAIYPVILDNFWRASVNAGRCSGTLSKRFDCAPAGVAGLFALKKGVQDLLTVFPTIARTQVESLTHLQTVYDAVMADRWAGSVNRRFYGGAIIALNESLLSALAALVIGALKAFNPAAPLSQSYALRRIANNAPIVTGVMEDVLEKAASRDEMVRSVVPQLEG
jgi:hypothetical protein